MRNSGLLKWASNNKNAAKAKTTAEDNGGNGKKWLHSPDTLKDGHVVYLVKFLGSTEVDQPKGIDVVKQGIQKLKFNQQLKKSEGGTKTPKVELTVSVEGVAIQEPKSKKVLHKYALHKISYCADDKAEKRFFSFIAKESENDKHTCFVFVSDKLAEEITLTIGQAFELAYKKFLDTSGKDMEAKKTLLALQKRVALLENENNVLKSRLSDVSKFEEVKGYTKANQLMDLAIVEDKAATCKEENKEDESSAVKEAESSSELICLEANVENGGFDRFTLDDLNDDYFNPRAGSSSDDEDVRFNPRSSSQQTSTPVLAPPPALPPRDLSKVNNININNNNKFHADPALVVNGSTGSSSNPFSPSKFVQPGAADPFGMSSFDVAASPTHNNQPFFDQSSFSKAQTGTLGFGDPWANAPAMPAINAMSLDDLDPLKK